MIGHTEAQTAYERGFADASATHCKVIEEQDKALSKREVHITIKDGWPVGAYDNFRSARVHARATTTRGWEVRHERREQVAQVGTARADSLA